MGRRTSPAYAERMKEMAARVEMLRREVDELEAGIERAEGKRRELIDARPEERENARVLALMPRATKLYRKQIDQGLGADPAASAKAFSVSNRALRVQSGGGAGMRKTAAVHFADRVGAGILGRMDWEPRQVLPTRSINSLKWLLLIETAAKAPLHCYRPSFPVGRRSGRSLPPSLDAEQKTYTFARATPTQRPSQDG
jgi:hypothetical protein